ncbi:MAG: Serine/threonine-protein kinase Nek2 [Sclerophora amabilis]|nr:MAG: Serine/threonine-protein kinase Nek2 [Sclerophora amabilis]
MSRPLPSGHIIENGFDRIRRLTPFRDQEFNRDVFLVRRKQDRKVCVQKNLPIDSILANRAQAEISIVRELRHKNVLEYVDAFLSHGPMGASLYTELCSFGSLDALIWKYDALGMFIPEGFIRSVFSDLADGLAYCHLGMESTTLATRAVKAPGWLSVLHRDLTPSKIFLKPSGGLYPRSVIGDFGCAIREDSPLFLREAFVCSTMIRPPEFPLCTEEADIWALGVVIRTLCRLDPAQLLPPPPYCYLRFWQPPGIVCVPRGGLLAYSDLLNFVMSLCQRMTLSERPNAGNLAIYLRDVLPMNPVMPEPLTSAVLPALR